MKKDVCELFAGVGGFRCGLNYIKSLAALQNPEVWHTVWFNQWEPSEKKLQSAHGVYTSRFGTCLDKTGEDTTNLDIRQVDMKWIPDFHLLTGSLPCQDYSVASPLLMSKGLKGRNGGLWWSVQELLRIKRPEFVLLDNVDRMLSFPSEQRGRDFGMVLACFRDLGYDVQWRVINAADYGWCQRRKRIFLFAYRQDTAYAYQMFHVWKGKLSGVCDILTKQGFFGQAFPVYPVSNEMLSYCVLPQDLREVSGTFTFDFQNTGWLHNGVCYTAKTTADYTGACLTLGDVLEINAVDEMYFIPEQDLYYTKPSVRGCDETKGDVLTREQRHTYQYLKGAKRRIRFSKNGHEYVYSEGSVPMIDVWDAPSRTILTTEGYFSRTTHVVEDKVTGRLRHLTARETEWLMGFPADYTKCADTKDGLVALSVQKRRSLMGNALVPPLIMRMEPVLSEIFAQEPDV